jgi:hypothetical protein
MIRVVFLLGIAAFANISCAYAVKAYPVCNFRCTPGQAGCDDRAALKLTDFDGIKTLHQRRGSQRALDFLALSNAYLLIGASTHEHELIKQDWAMFVCYPPAAPLTETQYQIYQRCVQNSQRWTELVQPRPSPARITSAEAVDSLLRDKDFRQVCMHASF